MTFEAMPLIRPRSQRDWIAAALRDGTACPPLDGFDVDELVAAAQYEDVLPLLEWRLHDGPGWQELPDTFRVALSEGARAAAMRSLFRENEQQRISKVLSHEGVRGLLLKGNALALWLYPQPYLRATCDIDLLFASRDEAHGAAQALSALGYALAFNPGSMNYEMTSRLTTDGISRSELDLHCRLINSVLYADIFSFQELWDSSFPLDGISESLKALAPVHALANACLNRALDMQIGEPDRLKLLYDIHLMLVRLDGPAWNAFVAMARVKGICGVCLRSIEDAIAALHTSVPASAMDELRSQANTEPLDRNRLQDWRYMQWQNFKALPTLRARLGWLWQRLVPTRSQLQELHGRDASVPVLLWRRVRRGIARVVGRG